MAQDACLRLADGRVYAGKLANPGTTPSAFGCHPSVEGNNGVVVASDGQIIAAGEIVIITAMVGYPEIICAAENSGKILVFTYPLIGNYGVPAHLRSAKSQAAAVIVREACPTPSHFGENVPLADFLKDQGIPLLSEVDTRAIMLSKITGADGMG